VGTVSTSSTRRAAHPRYCRGQPGRQGPSSFPHERARRRVRPRDRARLRRCGPRPL